MFPKELDGTKVLYYTAKGDFGVVSYPDGTIADHISYLAICGYEKESGYYLFLCNDNYKVITDDYLNTIEQCKELASVRNKNVVWIKSI